MLYAQRPLDGVGRAEHHRIFAGKFCGVPPEIPLFKTFPSAFPGIPRRQLCTEQPQGFFRKFIHFRVERVMLQLPGQFPLFTLQLPSFYNIKPAL